MEESPPGLTPVLDVFHELVCCEQVSGAIEDGTVSDVSVLVTTELPGIDGSGAEVTVTAFPHSFLHISLDRGLQVKSLVHLYTPQLCPLTIKTSICIHLRPS